MAVGLIALGLGITGITAHVAFTQPTALKYAVTVAAPAVMVLAALSSHPLRFVTMLMIVLNPFSSYVVSVSQYHVSLLAVMLVPAVGILICSGGLPSSSRTAVGRYGLVAGALLVPAVLLGPDPRTHAVHYLVIGVMVSLVAKSATSLREIQYVVAALLSSALLQAVLAIYSFKSGRSLSLYSASQTGADYFYSLETLKRPTGAFSDPISLGHYLAMAIPLGIAVVVACLRENRRLLALLAGSATFVITVGLIVTFSRLSWVGAAVGAVAVGLLAPKYTKVATLLGTSAMGGAAIVVAYSSAGQVLQQRFDSIRNPTGVNTASALEDVVRTNLWDAAINTFHQHPIFGVGFGNIVPELSSRVGSIVGSATHAHSTYFQYAAEAGLLGIAALVAVFAGVMIDIHRARRVLVGTQADFGNTIAAGVGAAFVALAIAWSTDYTVQYLQVAVSLAPYAGLLIVLSRRNTDRMSAASAHPPVPATGREFVRDAE